MPKLQVMVFGCNGQLGHELVQQLGESAVPKPRDVIDITRHKAVRELITHARPSVVVNCAGINSPTACERDRGKAWDVNTDAVDNLVKTCAIAGIPFLHVSCDQVFGSAPTPKTPFTETDAVGPVNVYGTTKLAAEYSIMRLGQCFCPDYWKAGFKYWIIRTSMLFERPWRPSNNWVYQLNQFSEYRHTCEIGLPTSIVRSPTFTPHLAKAIVWLLNHNKEVVSGIYNIANTGAPSLYDIGRHISTVSPNGLKIVPVDRDKYARIHGRDPSTMPAFTALDCSKFKEISSVALPTWQEGIEEFASTWEDS